MKILELKNNSKNLWIWLINFKINKTVRKKKLVQDKLSGLMPEKDLRYTIVF